MINITKNRSQQAFSPPALMTLLLTGSSNLEKLWGFIQHFCFLPTAAFLTSLLLSSFNVLPCECAESKPRALNDSTDPVKAAYQHRYRSCKFTFIYANFASPSHLQVESSHKASCAAHTGYDLSLRGISLDAACELLSLQHSLESHPYTCAPACS